MKPTPAYWAGPVPFRPIEREISVSDSDPKRQRPASPAPPSRILHTPGGDISATESIVDYLRSIFGVNIRAIVPQIAMSAGTMIALSCSTIILGKHSNLGPIDPQIGGIPAHGVIEEFNQAKAEVLANPATAMIWQPIIAKYTPTLVGQCVKAIQWSETMVTEWLKTGMFNGDADAQEKADSIVQELGSHTLTKSHGRHISRDRAKALGIKVITLEDDDDITRCCIGCASCMYSYSCAYSSSKNYRKPRRSCVHPRTATDDASISTDGTALHERSNHRAALASGGWPTHHIGCPIYRGITAMGGAVVTAPPPYPRSRESSRSTPSCCASNPCTRSSSPQ